MLRFRNVLHIGIMLVREGIWHLLLLEAGAAFPYVVFLGLLVGMGLVSFHQLVWGMIVYGTVVTSLATRLSWQQRRMVRQEQGKGPIPWMVHPALFGALGSGALLGQLGLLQILFNLSANLIPAPSVQVPVWYPWLSRDMLVLMVLCFLFSGLLSLYWSEHVQWYLSRWSRFQGIGWRKYRKTERGMWKTPQRQCQGELSQSSVRYVCSQA